MDVREPVLLPVEVLDGVLLRRQSARGHKMWVRYCEVARLLKRRWGGGAEQPVRPPSQRANTTDEKSLTVPTVCLYIG